jgi:hypothetical protein
MRGEPRMDTKTHRFSKRETETDRPRISRMATDQSGRGKASERPSRKRKDAKKQRPEQSNARGDERVMDQRLENRKDLAQRSPRTQRHTGGTGVPFKKPLRTMRPLREALLRGSTPRRGRLASKSTKMSGPSASGCSALGGARWPSPAQTLFGAFCGPSGSRLFSPLAGR